jgi:hypothetical protein
MNWKTKAKRRPLKIRQNWNERYKTHIAFLLFELLAARAALNIFPAEIGANDMKNIINYAIEKNDLL